MDGSFFAEEGRRVKHPSAADRSVRTRDGVHLRRAIRLHGRESDSRCRSGFDQGETRRSALSVHPGRRETILDATKDEQAENLWIPRLALYTGARANELCGLLTRDVKQIDGVWCPVVEDSEVRTLKTASSTRRIPVHPELIRLGFLDFVERQRAARQARLLPELTVGKYGSASRIASRTAPVGCFGPLASRASGRCCTRRGTR